jgi:hypothetical protein
MKERRRTIQNMTESSSISCRTDSRPVILCAMGGLANRIRAIDSARTLCRRFDRHLQIVWIRDSRQIAARFSDLFEPVDAPDVSVLEATFLDRLRYAPPSWHRNARIPVLWQFLRFGPSRRLSVPRGRILQRAGEIPPQFARRDRTVFLYAWWQMVPAEDRYAFFRPLPSLLAEVDALAATFPSARTIGVHVRRGDHAHAIRHSPVEAFEARMDALLATGEADSFFLATDDSVVRERLSRRYGPRLLFRDGSSARSTLAGMRGAVVDLWTLSRCTRLLASSGSTFAPTAAALGGIPCETVETPVP